MTNLQAEYSKIVEQRRHNEETERQGASSIQEEIRHNVRSEQLSGERNILDKQISLANIANASWRTKYENDVKKYIAELQNETNLAKLMQERELTETELRQKAEQIENQIKQTEAAIDAKIEELDIAQQNADTAKEKGGYSMLKKIWKDAKNKFGSAIQDRIDFLKLVATKPPWQALEEWENRNEPKSTVPGHLGGGGKR